MSTDWQQGQQLQQAQLELAWAQQEGNHSQKELHSKDMKLKEALEQLTQVQQEAQGLQKKLNTSERTLANAQICQITDC
ncbi:hypothetical protein Y1Q_0022067 [Alligator mississippiensis]|uniref:Uncharacterized protein n=1 Tax=Alligator mississippiensis TaxID=8496 RepID=A0A151NV70_ALLMI|nr:hypothetical protein Y1Q_0022067 [Alligator mississippiensis]